MWNLLNNEVHAICDVTFNERAFFSGNIDDLRDDLLCISDERLQALLEAHRAPGNNSDTSIATQEEDEELSNLQTHQSEDVEEISSGQGPKSQAQVGTRTTCGRGTNHPILKLDASHS